MNGTAFDNQPADFHIVMGRGRKPRGFGYRERLAYAFLAGAMRGQLDWCQALPAR